MADAGAESGRLAENIMHFARVLRAAGLRVGPARVVDAIQAVERVGITRRDDLYWTLHATLIDRHEAHEIFDQAFHIFWRDPKLIDRMMAMMLPEIKAAERDDEEQVRRRLMDALFKDAKDHEEPKEPDVEVDASETFSHAEALARKDFEQMSVAELAEAKAALARLRLPVEDVPTRRKHPSQRGRLIDMRATFRASLRAADTIPLKRQAYERRKPPLVVLCDVSGSMSVYSRLFLHFLHAVAQRGQRVHSFVFGTRLTYIGRALQHEDVDEALARVSGMVDDWDGGTRIGETLREFNIRWGRRVLAQGAIVLLVTDGLDRDAGEGIEPEIARLHRLSRRLIWLNPLLRYDAFEPKSLGIRALLPHVDEFRPVHNVNSFSALIDALSEPAPSPLKWRADAA